MGFSILSVASRQPTWFVLVLQRDVFKQMNLCVLQSLVSVLRGAESCIAGAHYNS